MPRWAQIADGLESVFNLWKSVAEQRSPLAAVQPANRKLQKVEWAIATQPK
jgi:hypothetical protein